MPFNPCGRVVDFGRRPYSTKFRPFSDNATEVDLHWYPALPDAPVLDRPSFVSLDSEPFPWAKSGFGEVYNAERPWSPRKAVDGALGVHVCGTDEQFSRGASYDPDIEPIVYGENGLPACCDVPDGIQGGVELSGSDPVYLYGREYSYTEAGNPHVVLWRLGFVDVRWSTFNPPDSETWGLFSPIVEGAGLWRLAKQSAPTRTYVNFAPAAWDGRGACTFIRTAFPFNTITVTNTDPPFWWLPPGLPPPTA